MKEVRVYVIDIHKFSFFIKDMSDDEFISIAEKQGGVYTLKGFENAFNNEEINTFTDYIRFIEVEIPNKEPKS